MFLEVNYFYRNWAPSSCSFSLHKQQNNKLLKLINTLHIAISLHLQVVMCWHSMMDIILLVMTPGWTTMIQHTKTMHIPTGRGVITCKIHIRTVPLVKNMSVNTNSIQQKINIVKERKIEVYQSSCGLCKVGEKLFPRSSFTRGDKLRSGQTLLAWTCWAKIALQ